jgi:DNA-binding MarR family transcriptional regulator
MRQVSAHDEQLVRQVMDGLRRIVRALRLSATDIERDLGITVAQLFVLQQLADGKPRSVNEIAEGTVTDPSTVSGILRRLLSQKLVRRDTSPHDARRAHVTLTPKGKALLARAPQAPQARLVEVLALLPSRRLKALARELDALARRLGPTRPGFFFED